MRSSKKYFFCVLVFIYSLPAWAGEPIVEIVKISTIGTLPEVPLPEGYYKLTKGDANSLNTSNLPSAAKQATKLVTAGVSAIPGTLNGTFSHTLT